MTGDPVGPVAGEPIDISPPISPRTAVWPGDVPFERRVSLDVEAGDNLTLSAITTTVHVGAHADAPNHYRRGGAGIGARPLAPYVGPCQVIDAPVARGARITPGDLQATITTPRVLLRTGTFPNPEHFNTDFASLSPALIAHLAAIGVRLVGIDTPSIDPFDDGVLQSHQAVADHDLCVLEGLVLDHVAAGRWWLLALPLRLVGADASPVRAALLPLAGGDSSAPRPR